MQGAVPLRGKETGSGGILYSARPTSIVSTPCGLLTVLVLRQLQGRRVGRTEQTTCGIARCFGSTEQTTRGIARCFESQKQSVEFCIGTAVLVMDECLNKQHRPLLKLSSGNECGAVVEWY